MLTQGGGLTHAVPTFIADSMPDCSLDGTAMRFPLFSAAALSPSTIAISSAALLSERWENSRSDGRVDKHTHTHTQSSGYIARYEQIRVDREDRVAVRDSHIKATK